MTFRLEHPEEPLDDNVRAAAKAEFDRAMGEVSEAGFEIHETVRNVRRRLKRVRAILRLIRPVFPEYASENAQLRDIGAEVSDLRDAAALVETIDSLSLRPEVAEAGALGELRHRLAQKAADRERQLDRGVFLTQLRGRLRDARVRSELWELRDSGAAAVVPGFVATYKKARSGFRASLEAPRRPLLHDWRKLVKYHWAQLGLMRSFAPEFSEVRRQRVGRLAATLGNYHNVCVLREAPEVADGSLPPVSSLLERECGRLAKRALKLGRPLFAEAPSVVEQRWSGYLADLAAVRRLTGR